MASRLEAEHLYKVFGRRPEEAMERLQQGVDREELRADGITAAVIDASFTVEPGQIFVVMGLSGSGKSTLLRMLNGLLEPTGGHVRFDGQDLTQLSARELREVRARKISMVFQHFALFPHRSVRENAAYGLEVQGVPRAERNERAAKALELAGLAGWEKSWPDELSGGMQQRVGLARALATDADLLLMDESFSALDPLIRRDMQDQLIELQKKLKKTIVFITHDLNEAMRLGDRIAVMRDGRIVQIGTAEDILVRPADDYVASFTQDVDRSRVLTAGALMDTSVTREAPSAPARPRPPRHRSRNCARSAPVCRTASRSWTRPTESSVSCSASDCSASSATRQPTPRPATTRTGRWPSMPRIPFGDWVNDTVDWLLNHMAWFFDFLKTVFDGAYDGVNAVLQAPQPLLLAGIFAVIAFWLRGTSAGVLTFVGFAFIDSLELWEDAMVTLSLVLVATLIALVISVPVGIWAARSDRVSSVVRPVLDFMQTLPAMIYLIPAILFFGTGAPAGMVATLIFALAPGVRMTELGIRQVDKDLVEAADAFGTTPATHCCASSCRSPCPASWRASTRSSCWACPWPPSPAWSAPAASAAT